MAENKIRILFCSNSLNKPSGLGYVVTSLMKRFAYTDNFEIGFAAITGEPLVRELFLSWDEEFKAIFEDKIPMFNTQIEREETVDKFDVAIKEFKPDIVFSIHDPWCLEQIAYSDYREFFYWACYTFIETPSYPECAIFPTNKDFNARKSIKMIYEQADIIIPCTQMAKEALEKYNISNISENVYAGLDTVQMNKHIGVNRQSVFGSTVTDDLFIFMTMGENTERKRIEMIVEAYRKFLDQVMVPQKYRLYIHTNLNELKQGTDLLTTVFDLNLVDNVLFPKKFMHNEYMSRDELYARYAVCDAYIGLPGGEGFGYGFAEALFYGKPIIYTDYGGHVEYLKDFGFPVKPKAFIAARNIYTQWAIADIDECVLQMHKVIMLSSKDKKQLERKARNFVTSNMDWAVIAKNLLSVLEKNFVSKNSVLLKNFGIKRVL